MVAAAAVMQSGMQALATGGVGRSRMARRQIADCMTKRMYADRTLSYIDAKKACKDEMMAQSDRLAANAPAEPVKGR